MVSSGKSVTDEVGTDKLWSPDAGSHACFDSKIPTSESDQGGQTPSIKSEKDPLPDTRVHASQSEQQGNVSSMITQKSLLTPSLLPGMEGSSPVVCEKALEDGYNWHKYKQKLVEGNEFVRSYYKCTHPNCQVKKQLECSHDGKMIDTVYFGQHDHPKPLNLPLADGSIVSVVEEQPNNVSPIVVDGKIPASQSDQGGRTHSIKTEIDPLPDTGVHTSRSEQLGNASSTITKKTSLTPSLLPGMEFSVVAVVEDRPDNASPVVVKGKISTLHFDQGGRTPAIKPEIDPFPDTGVHTSQSEQIGNASSMITKKTSLTSSPLPGMDRSSPVVREQESEDGYNWRKYGQKLVEGNEFVRSYYKCTHPNCQVKKQLKRSHDGKMVDTVYVGQHDHPKPLNPPLAVGSVISVVEERPSNASPIVVKGKIPTSQSDHGGRTPSIKSEKDPLPDPGVHPSQSKQLGNASSVITKKTLVTPSPLPGMDWSSPVVRAKESEDGYNWRKYGQKLVKGNEFVQSYYKCTHPNCQVKKQLKHSHDGKMVDTIYVGRHDHPKPLNVSPAVGSVVEERPDNASPIVAKGKIPMSQSDQGGRTPSIKSEKDPLPYTGVHTSQSEQLGNVSSMLTKKTSLTPSPLPGMEGSSPVVGEKDLEDGYNWRKYGQKLVKGNEFVRSYYKCTHPNCQVKKQLKRSHDGKVVDTIYVGQHDHPKPLNLLLTVGSVVEERPDNASPIVVKGKIPTSQFDQGKIPTIQYDQGGQTPSIKSEKDPLPDTGVHTSQSEQLGHASSVLTKKTSLTPSPLPRMEASSPVVGEKESEDGYNWRKYGQKLVKGNEFVRSYYKCTHPKCQVKKQLKCSHDGKVVDTIYVGQHDHPKPLNLPLAVGSVVEGQPDNASPIVVKGKFPTSQSDQRGQNPSIKSEKDPLPDTGVHTSQSEQLGNASSTLTKKTSLTPSPLPGIEGSSPVVGEKESKDGYNWRKYGQKLVKGNEFVRSYYKCTHLKCQVKKQLKRSHDGKVVDTIYVGQHDHPKPLNLPLAVGSVLEQRPDNASPIVVKGKIPTSQSDQGGKNPSIKSEKDPLPDTGFHTSQSEQLGNASSVLTKKTSLTPSSLPGMEGSSLVVGDKESEDGYNWRKYGQKLVKGNEFVRSYYKCTHPKCQVKKQLKSSHDGKMVDTIYVGQHDHPKPLNLPLAVGSVVEERPDNASPVVVKCKIPTLQSDKGGQTPSVKSDKDPVPDTGVHTSQSEQLGNASSMSTKKTPLTSSPLPGVEGSSPVVGESVLEDGYNWRKYGQKLVKGNEFVRSYYKCTHPNCQVKKQLKRSHDGKMVDTLYVGQHDHPRPLNLPLAVGSVVEERPDNASPVVVKGKIPTSQSDQGGQTPSLKSEKDPLPDTVVHTSQTEQLGNASSMITKKTSLTPSPLPGMEKSSPVVHEKQLEDGYNWRKYGQKLVKGNEFVRSYYRCTHPNCQMKKQLKCSHDGKMVDIVYFGQHDHPKPLNLPLAVDFVVSVVEKRPDNASPILVKDKSFDARNEMACQIEPRDGSEPLAVAGGENVKGAPSKSNSILNVADSSDDHLISKRRKKENNNADASLVEKLASESGLAMKTLSEVDSVNDGYRWRKYGQKLIKGNPNPRSYYRCSNPGCHVKKHVERASHDAKLAITTYEVQHDHDFPPSRTVTKRRE